MTPEHFIAISNLENDIWDEELLGEQFYRLRRWVLAPKERQILEMRCQGMSIADICKLMTTKQGGMQKPCTIDRVCYEIKRKFRTGQRQRADNHPVLRFAQQLRGEKLIYECTVCGVCKFESAFYKDRGKRRKDCKLCNNERGRQYGKDHHDEIIAHKKQYNKEHMNQIVESNRKIRKKHPWNLVYGYIYQRCNCKAHSAYKYYGGKGIKCAITTAQLKYLWKRDGAWEMKRPSIDRIDPDKNYTLNNCRFLELGDNVRRARAAKQRRGGK